MQKPKTLYHASSNTHIDEFVPRNETPRYKNEELFVFATPHKQLAAMFLAPRNIPVEISKFGNKYVIFINSDENEFKKNDSGGAIYELPSETFNTNKNVGMKEAEWVSAQPVKPTSNEIYETSIEAMCANDVGIYFVNKQLFKKIQANPGCALDLV